MMKKIIIAILAVIATASCNKPFEENYETLVLDKYEYALDADGGSLQLMVYYSKAWRAEVSSSAGTDWLILSRTEAPGQAYIRITYDSYAGTDRDAYIDFIPSEGEPVQLKLTQTK